MPEPVDDAAGPGLQKLLAPRSIAIVGASTRPGTSGNGLVRQVLEGGFPGPVHPVNPRYEQVEGLRCVPALAELPKPADLALLAVEAEHAEAQLQAAAGTGTRAAVIYASLQHHPGADARLAAIASAAGMAVCGANCMGFLNLEQPLRACACRRAAQAAHPPRPRRPVPGQSRGRDRVPARAPGNPHL